jgi:hypothetical protein
MKYSQQFMVFEFFFVEKARIRGFNQIFFVSLHRSYPRPRANGWDNDILRSVIDALFLTV